MMNFRHFFKPYWKNKKLMRNYLFILCTRTANNVRIDPSARGQPPTERLFGFDPGPENVMLKHELSCFEHKTGEKMSLVLSPGDNPKRKQTVNEERSEPFRIEGERR